MSSITDQISSITEMDLPLMANANEIRARHYMLHLELPARGWHQKIFHGQVIIFLEPLIKYTDHVASGSSMDTSESLKFNNRPDFECILDCCDLSYNAVREVILPSPYKERFYGENDNLLTFEERKNIDLMRSFFR